ncbi:MAG: hypothetical protein OXB88_03455 [Bacteriovoracales bacterium]|nr:hypothetical protein [Bacteriovoracales bacterium]
MKVLLLLIWAFKLSALELFLINREGGEREFIAGDLLKARLEVHSKNRNQNLDNFFQFLEKGKLGPFTVIDHQKPIENDQGLKIESIELDIVLRDEVKSSQELFHTYNDSQIPIRLKGFKYKFIGLEPKVSIFNLELPEKKNLGLWILIISITLAIGIVSWHFFSKRKRSLNQARRDKLKLVELFSNLRSREKLELVYEKRAMWEHKVRLDERRGFYAALNRHQYKKNWTSDDLNEVYKEAKKIEIKFHG